MVPAIRALIARRKLNGPLAIDVCKLSHHGSRSNTTIELTGLVRARHHIVSTDNSHFKHPDPEAIARVVLGCPGTTLWFDYDTPQNRRWGAADLATKYRHQVRYPARPGAGLLMQLP